MRGGCADDGWICVGCLGETEHESVISGKEGCRAGVRGQGSVVRVGSGNDSVQKPETGRRRLRRSKTKEVRLKKLAND